MKIFTKEEVDACTCSYNGELEHDEQGQLIVYTGIYQWKDGSCRDQPEPSNGLHFFDG